MLRIATVGLFATCLATAQGDGVPSEAEQEAARPAVLRAMADRVVRAVGGDVRRASSEVLAAAFEAGDRATRYLLWQHAVRIAAEEGDAWLALQHDASMASEFALDPVDSGVALLRRMAADAQPLDKAAIGLAAYHRANDFAGADGDDRAMLRFYDVAVRATLAAGHAPLFAHVRDRLPLLRAPVEVGALLRPRLPESPWRPEMVANGLLYGEVRTLEPYKIGDLAGALEDLAGLDARRPARDLTTAELVRLAGRASHAQLRVGMLRCAQQRLARSYHGADAARRREICDELVAVTERLCTEDGVSRLRFTRPDAVEQLAISHGDWRVEDGLLIGTAKGANNFATHKVAFATTNVAVIRGGIRSDAGLNFRCKVGDVNLLLNWEVEPQNHLWIDGACLRDTPPALTPGEEHTILVFSDGANAHVAIDGEHRWTVRSFLGGTVSVYPALDSQIFVREILVDGTPNALVDAPIGVMM